MLTHWVMGGVQTSLQESERIAAKENLILDTDILLKQYLNTR